MNLFRKWIVAAMTALALAVPLAVAPSAQANSPSGAMNRPRAYYIYVRTCPDQAWVCYGYIYDYNQAQQWVVYLNELGYQAFSR